MNIRDGRIGLTRDELEGMRARGFAVSEHTAYYMNGVTASCGDVTIGLYNWLDGLDAYVGDTQLFIKTDEQAQRFFAAMDGLIELRNAMTPNIWEKVT